MRRITRRVSLFALVLMAGVSLAAEDRVGEVVFVDGTPAFVRDGRELTETVDFGYPVENFDTVMTDDRSELEIAIDPETGIDVAIRVAPDTTFYLDLSSYQQRQRGVIELISGSINVNAREIREGSGFLIHTPTSAMGVRGTVFSVDTSPGGEILVVPEEGVVEVNTMSGQRGFARTGQAIEIDTVESVVRTLRFSPDQRQAFRDSWRAERREQLVERAPELIRRLGRQYRVMKERFVTTYAELMRRRDVLDQWMEEGRRGPMSEGDVVRRQVQALAPVLLQLRSGLRAFEQLFARLERLREFLPDGSGSLEVQPGFTIADVYEEIGTDRAVMRDRFHEVRYALKLFAMRNNGVVPRSILGQVTGVENR